MTNEMTPAQALQILDTATLPMNAGRLNRADYTNIQAALVCLADFVEKHAAEKKDDSNAVPDHKL